jgi:hypothetical protein
MFLSQPKAISFSGYLLEPAPTSFDAAEAKHQRRKADRDAHNEDR